LLVISLLGIPLALACALATNIGFLFKHRGACAAPAVDMRRPLRTARLLFASRLFTIGMGIASIAWIFHVAALSVAPMSLVQSVLAGRSLSSPVRRCAFEISERRRPPSAC
jgi:hypothetical protein